MNARVELGTAHETETEVRFPLVAPYPASFFSIGDYVRIQGFETTTAFNGKWPVYDVATDHSWFSVQFPTGLADDAGGTAGEWERGVVGLSSATENIYEATFTVNGSVAFTPFHTVVVQGFQGPTFEGYNGTWIVDGVDTGANTFSAKVNSPNLGTGGSGSAGAQGLTCGQLESNPTRTDPGALSYDTAAYWAPSVWTTDGAFAPPVRARVYYVGLPGGQLCTDMHRNCVIQIPEGAGIAGGNPDAADPTENPHVLWTCGHKPHHISPVLNHPYDCSPFSQVNSWDFVDGPVAVVDLPRCGPPVVSPSSGDPSALGVVYSDQDGGPDPTGCDGDHPTSFPQISVRFTHRTDEPVRGRRLPGLRHPEPHHPGHRVRQRLLRRPDHHQGGGRRESRAQAR